MYNWQRKDWPAFRYDVASVQDRLAAFAEKTGRVSGLLEGLADKVQTETIIETMVLEAIKTSAIEGEYLSRQDVMSSIRNHLGMAVRPERVADVRADGAAQLMLAVRDGYQEPLTQDMLFGWHEKLMIGSHGVFKGAWRTHASPMQVVSGPIGKEKVHFEAPPSTQVSEEMIRFIAWFNKSAPGKANEIKQAPIRSALAHLYFESIHPFEDGNGRIGRSISEKALAQGIGRPVLLSLSKAIEAKRSAYYDALKVAQRSGEVTPWIEYFVALCLEAQRQAETQISFTLQKAKFLDAYAPRINPRQLKVLERMLEEGPEGFEGGMSAKKYVNLTHVSKATATRDLQDLFEKGALEKQGGGRSTRYRVKLP